MFSIPIVQYYSRLPAPTKEWLRGGDKHSVVDSDANSAKHNNINIGCKDITSIISRYFRTAGTWRGVFEPSTAASDE